MCDSRTCQSGGPSLTSSGAPSPAAPKRKNPAHLELWRYTRHPNYFGDALVWWGPTLIALAAPGSLWTLVSPIVMTILLVRISGAALLEKDLARTKPGYREYERRTSAFIPSPPRK